MANDKKFVVKNGLTTQNISFVDSTATTVNTINLDMTSNDALSFSGESGQLFSIADSMTGSIFTVNDISGIPSIEVIDTGLVKLAEFSGNVLLGTPTDNGVDKLQVNGTILATTFKGAVTGNVTGNATTATTLQTARTIGGVSFDGSANINLPGVNTAGNQNTTGSAATLTTARTINGTSFNGSANITTANWGTSRTLWGQSVNGSADITAPLLPAAGNEALPAFSTSGDTNTGMFFPTADTIAFSNGGTEVMRIDSANTGRLSTTKDIIEFGFNYNSGVKALKFQRTELKAAIWSVPLGSYGRADIRFTTGDDLSATAKTEANAVIRIAPAGGLVVGNSYLAQNPADGNLIVSGNVGIGNTAPAVKLQVEGSVRFASDGSGANYLQFQRTTSNSWKLTSDGIGDIFSVVGNSITLLQDTTIQRGGLTVSPTLASAQSAINITQTWNSAATIFTLIKGNVTDTASNTASLLMDLQTGGVSKAKISKAGDVTATSFVGPLTGNATTATTLQTARTIGGVSFDGSANINLPGVNTTGNQNTTGSAATLTTGRTVAITGDLSYTSGSFNGSTNVTGTGTLATVNSNVGSFTNASVTVNAKGLVTAASSGTAPVTSVTGTSPVSSSGGTTPAISLASGYGDTQNPYASKTANFVLAAPNGSAGVPTFRAIVAADIPTLNQNTTGTAAGLSATLAVASGGTGVTTSTGTGSVVLSISPTFTGTVAAANLTLSGDLTINGTTTTINSTTISVDDKNIELGSVASPTNITADGGGITLKGATDKTFNWVSATGAWTSSENVALAAGKNILLNGSTSGTITLAAAAAAGTNTITFPAITGTVVTTGDTGSVTNTMLAGSIANAKLTNSSVTIGSTAVSLGATVTTFTGLSSVTSTTFVGALTGNASTATTLQTARTINGTSFNGSSNITTANWGTARDINGTSVDGSGNYAIGRIYDTNYRRITNPGGGESVNNAATTTGAIAVTLPVGVTSTMVRMTIKVYEYTTNESFEVHVGGYNYIGGTWANNPFAYIIGNPGVDRRFNVRLGYNATTDKSIVYIGELASTWAYPQVYVTEVMCGHSGQQVAWTTGWSVGFEATAFQSVTATIANCQVGYAVSTNTSNSTVLRDGSGNFSAGTISAALTGNASTATTLQTARTINGTSFNGSANITTANWGTARTLWGQSVNGSADITAPLLPAAGTVSLPAFSTSGDTNTGIFFPAADTIAFAEGGAEVMRIDSSGNVGIGTSSVTFKVDTSLGTVNNNTTNYGYNIFADATSSVGYSGYNLQLNNSTGNATGFVRLARTSSTAYLGMEIQSQSRDGIRFLTDATTPVEVVRINASGNVGIGTTTPGYKLEVNGSFAATSKSFLIPHPTKSGMKLRHGSLEGPEHGVYVRGKTQTNIIELPEYWTKLVDPDSITVQLTPIGKHQKLYVEKIEGNKVYIANDSMLSSSINCFYYIQAERIDVEKMVVEID